ncbi:MAG: MBL fold metallo-hydrolase [Eudoraea sp.]|nr:MBL fold metallo-hydrolase [Eudoraea sp.]
MSFSDVHPLFWKLRRVVGVDQRIFPFVFSVFLMLGCKSEQNETGTTESAVLPDDPFIVVLGTVQDAGIPQLGCEKSCCQPYQETRDPDLNVVALGLIDPSTRENYLFEATPDINRQLTIMNSYVQSDNFVLPNGVFLTHAHMGHYTGLMQLGREAINADSVPVYTMPRMKSFLEQNGPWDQLLSLGNIVLRELQNEQAVVLNDRLRVAPIEVPHRDEYSETVGFTITGPNKSALFIPDIDKWDKWGVDISEMVRKVDYAFLDATFYDAAEINNRDISEIPHPFVVESMALFRDLPVAEKNKIHFIHFNHTNPLLNPESTAYEEVLKNGFNVARTKQIFSL